VRRSVGVKPAYLDKVIGLSIAIEADPAFVRQASALAKTYADLRREADDLAAKLADAKLRLAAVTMLMVDQFEVEGEKAVTLTNGDNIRWQPEPSLVVTDKEAFRQWCLKQQLDRDMVLPWSKANKLVKEMLVAGDEEPPGTECFVRTKVVFSKGR